MSKVFLISSNLFTSPYPVYPLGMAVISSALSDKGHTVHQFDFIVEDKSEDVLEKKIREFNPDFIGISIRNIDNVDSLCPDASWSLFSEKHMVSLVRNCTDVPIIVGGSGFSAMPDEIMDYVGADYGVIGEGEQILCDLIEALANGGSAPKIIRRSEALIEGREMYSPLWESRFMDFYIRESGMVNLQTKRGCPHDCSYCVYPALEGKRFRFREPGSVVEDLKLLQRLYNADTVFFTDSVFNDPEGHYLELAEVIISSGLKLRWSGYFRPKGIGAEELRLLKRSGLYAMEVGSDAGCDETLHNMGKGFYFKDVIDFNLVSVKEEIPSAYFFIFGGPGETEKTLDEGLRNIRMLKNSAYFIYSGARILPGAGLYRRALKEGILSEKDSLLKPVYYFSPHIDIEAMNRMLEREAKDRPEFIFPPEKGTMMSEAMKTFGYKGLLWDKMISFDEKAYRRKRKSRDVRREE